MTRTLGGVRGALRSIRGGAVYSIVRSAFLPPIFRFSFRTDLSGFNFKLNIMSKQYDKFFHKNKYGIYSEKPKQFITQIILGNKLHYQKATALIFQRILFRLVYLITDVKKFLSVHFLGNKLDN